MPTEERQRSVHAHVADDRKPLVPWGRGPTVLLVEDDDEMRALLGAALRRDGYRVVEAEDGGDALEWLGLGALDAAPAHFPALIVSDILLPRATGLEILECVRLAARSVPVLLVTGFGNAPTHARAMELGAVGVLDKPFGLRAFRAAVADALERPPEPPPWERDGHRI